MAVAKKHARSGRKRALKRRAKPRPASVAVAAGEDGYISPQQFAKHFGISEMSTYRMIERGELGHIRIGRMIRLPADAIEQWTRQHTVGARVLVPAGAVRK